MTDYPARAAGISQPRRPAHGRRIWRGVAALSLAVAATCLNVGMASAEGGDEPLQIIQEWHPFSSTTQLPGAFLVDPGIGVGWALSGDTATAENGWAQATVVSLTDGKRLGGPVAIPSAETRTPILVDTRRHLLIYAENQLGGVQAGLPFSPNIVGLSLTGRTPHVAFRVASPLGLLRIAGMAFDEKGDDLFVLGTAAGSAGVPEAGSSVVELQRLSIATLLAGQAGARWTSPYEIPKGQCPALIQIGLPAAVLVAGDSVLFGCRGTAPFVAPFEAQSPLTSGVMRLDGATTAAAPPIVPTFHTMPGNYAVYGETVADQRTHRLVAVDAAGLIGVRVYDAMHNRFVGRLFAGAQHINGLLTSPSTGRLYYSSADPKVGLGESDLGALVPTQGVLAPAVFTGRLQRHYLRMSVDDKSHRLFIPTESATSSGSSQFSLMVVSDRQPAYVPPPGLDYDAGALDVKEREGVTDNTRSAVAEAFGADYQLIGGTANLLQNATGVDPGGQGRPGTRYLRQAIVENASLTGDGALATALAAREDDTTSADRNGAGAGDQFAPAAECTDFGSSPTRSPVSADTAQVECVLEKQMVRATAQFTSQGAITTLGKGGTPSVLPVQSSSSGVSVTEQRKSAANSPLVITVTAYADNVTIAGQARFGRVSSTVIVSSNGRSGHAVARRTVTVSDVTLNGAPVCSSVCPLPEVVAKVNDALGSRGHVDFPGAEVIRSAHGTYAQVRQDPWYHAERILDYDKADDDYAVPAMTVVTYFDGLSKSRLVSDFAGVAAAGSYRIFALNGDPIPEVDVPPAVVPSPPRGAPTPVVNEKPIVSQPSAETPTEPAAGPFASLTRGMRLLWRSPSKALPLLFVLSLLALPEYLSARRRLLLELPLLRREVPAP